MRLPQELSRFFKKKKHLPLFQQQDIAHYFANDGHLSVGGWLSPFSLSAIKLISDFQIEEDIDGNIAEIGVFHGRFFIGLCLLLTTTERSIAIDVFDLQEFNLDNSGTGDYKIFKDNIKKFIPAPDIVTILKKDSLAVKPSEISNQIGNDLKVRIFSVDGCHTAGHTENDMTLAQDILSEGGVIIVDDFCNPDWPEVEPGVKNFLQKSPSIKPFAFVYNKLYLTNTAYYQRYIDYFKNFTKKRAVAIEWMKIEGTKVIMAIPPPPEQCFADTFVNFIDFASQSSHKYLGEGWYPPEPWGVWSDGKKEATVNLDNDLDGYDNIAMLVSLHAFVTPAHQEVIIDIFVDSEKVDTIIFPYGKDYINWKVILPSTIINRRHWTISFHVKNAISPQELNISADDRPLGVGLRSMYFAKLTS